VSLGSGNIPLLLAALTIGAKRNENNKAAWIGIFLLCSLCIFPIYFEREPHFNGSHYMVYWQFLIIAIFTARTKTYQPESIILLLMTASAILNPEYNIISAYLHAGLFLVAGIGIANENLTKFAVPIAGVLLLASAALNSLDVARPVIQLFILSTAIIILGRPMAVRFPPIFHTHNLVSTMLGGLVVIGIIVGTQDFAAEKNKKFAAWIEAQRWARNNTPSHTVFLPVGVVGFSVLSRRPVWIDKKMGAMVMWSPEHYDFWSSRYAKQSKIRTTSDAMNLMNREKINYLVYDKSRNLDWKFAKSCVQFENTYIAIIARPMEYTSLSDCRVDEVGDA
ncbi:MAG: hypothetical protein AAF362_05585, partial [Pseudomonadota bacterium]